MQREKFPIEFVALFVNYFEILANSKDLYLLTLNSRPKTVVVIGSGMVEAADHRFLPLAASQIHADRAREKDGEI